MTHLSKCRYCGGSIVWLKDLSGKSIPVEPDNVEDDDEDYDPSFHQVHFRYCNQEHEAKPGSRWVKDGKNARSI